MRGYKNNLIFVLLCRHIVRAFICQMHRNPFSSVYHGLIYIKPRICLCQWLWLSWGSYCHLSQAWLVRPVWVRWWSLPSAWTMVPHSFSPDLHRCPALLVVGDTSPAVDPVVGRPETCSAPAPKSTPKYNHDDLWRLNIQSEWTLWCCCFGSSTYYRDKKWCFDSYQRHLRQTRLKKKLCWEEKSQIHHNSALLWIVHLSHSSYFTWCFLLGFFFYLKNLKYWYGYWENMLRQWSVWSNLFTSCLTWWSGGVQFKVKPNQDHPAEGDGCFLI